MQDLEAIIYDGIEYLVGMLGQFCLKLKTLILDILLSRTLKKSIPILLKLGLNSSMILNIMFENVLKSFKQN